MVPIRRVMEAQSPVVPTETMVVRAMAVTPSTVMATAVMLAQDVGSEQRRTQDHGDSKLKDPK